MTETTSFVRDPGPDHITLYHTLRGHTKEILSVAWSPDSARLASGSADGTLRLWDGSKGKLLYTSGGDMGWGVKVQWSPDGTRLLSWASDWGIHLWDRESMALLHELGRDGEAHLDYIDPVQWSPNGLWLTSRSVDGSVCLWNGINGKLVSILGRNLSNVFWSPDGTRLAACNVETTISWSPDGKRHVYTAEETTQLWDDSCGQSLQILQREMNAWFLAWSPDEKLLASCFKDGKVRLWESESGKLLHTLRGHKGSVYSAVWSPDGTQLASGSSDRTVRVWNGSSGQPLRILEGHNHEVREVSWSPDGMWLASGTSSPDFDTEVCIWHASTWQLLARLSVRARWAPFAWHPSLPRLATAASSPGDICLWQLDGKA